MSRVLQLFRAPLPWWILTGIWFAVLFVFSSISRLPAGPEIPYQDKVIHTLYFAAGATCACLALRARRQPMAPLRAFLFAILFCMVVGAFDEWHQTHTPGRSGNDFGDWLADALGGVLGGGLGALLWQALRPRSKENTSNPGA